MKRALFFLLLTVSVTACSSSRAQVRIDDAPTLVVPPVPPRVIEPVPSTEPHPIEPVPDLPTTAAVDPPKSKAPTRDRNAEKPGSKPESLPETSPAPPPQPVPPLRTSGSPVGPEIAQQQVRDVLDRARKTLSTINYEQLTQERKDNYEAAKNFITEAEAALKANNYVQAKALADRAENTAKLLSGR
jgi:hypothetical protein